MPLGDGRFRVRRIEKGNTSSVEPPFDPSWSPLAQLRWHAAVAELDAGSHVRIRVQDATGWSRRKPAGSDRWISYTDIYSVSAPGHGFSPMGFDAAWTFITALGVGIGVGLRAAEARDALRRSDPDEETPIYDRLLAERA